METCFIATKSLVGVWAILAAAEWLYNVELFSEDGLLSWKILKLRSGVLCRFGELDFLSSATAVKCVLLTRIVAAGCMLIVPTFIVDAVCLLIIVVSSLYMSYRTCFGGDGSDQMGLIVSVGALLMALGLALTDQRISNAGVLLIGGQATLSYFVAGTSKLVSPIWRGGDALMGVMSTQTYGHLLAVKIAGQRPLLCSFVCWLVIITEMLFPLALVAPVQILIVCLAGFGIFHLSNAYFMGLNAFVWPFVATYPSVVVLNDAIRNLLH